MNEKFQDFRKRLSPDQYPNMIIFALNMHVMFASAYLCESTFLIIKREKPITRNRMNE